MDKTEQCIFEVDTIYSGAFLILLEQFISCNALLLHSDKSNQYFLIWVWVLVCIFKIFWFGFGLDFSIGH